MKRVNFQRNRRRLLTGASAAFGSFLLTGCDRLSQADWVRKTLGSAEHLSRSAQRWLAGNDALAREYPASAVAPEFRANGNTDPQDETYKRMASDGFVDWRIPVVGLVDNPLELSLVDLRAMPSRTQITRHDCVEGWSCIGKWTGAVLADVLDAAQVREEARYVVFHCADKFSDAPYYESIDLVTAYHPQTLLAYGLNDADLPVANGAPLRLRAERQLGYKMAKYIQRIELVDSYANLHGGKGGFWEDRGYSWYAGI